MRERAYKRKMHGSALFCFCTGHMAFVGVHSALKRGTGRKYASTDSTVYTGLWEAAHRESERNYGLYLGVYLRIPSNPAADAGSTLYTNYDDFYQR